MNDVTRGPGAGEPRAPGPVGGPVAARTERATAAPRVGPTPGPGPRERDAHDIPLVEFTTTGNGYVDVWVNEMLVHSEPVPEGPQDMVTGIAINRALAIVSYKGMLD